MQRQFPFSFQVFFGCDKDQEILLGFMQDIAQGGQHLIGKHITPSCILPGVPEIPVPRLRYRM
jgi:hypothetical protein